MSTTSPMGSVIIPAHNEAGVILRTLGPLAQAAASGAIEIIVVCNGCTDDTAALAATVPNVTVLETGIPSKARALNMGDAAASAWPRLYLDADIQISESTVTAVLNWLTTGKSLAARPRAVYDVAGADVAVRSFYRARARIPSMKNALWGAGVYGLSVAGHDRLGRFPETAADDLWVDRLFRAHEKAVLDTSPAVVRTPRRLGALVSITRRNVRGTRQQRASDHEPESSLSTLAELAATVRGPLTAADAAIYACVAALARVRKTTAQNGWERDDTSRE